MKKVTGGSLVPSYIFDGEANILQKLLGVNVTEDGEIWITETERENDVGVIYVESTIAASKYVLMIDLNGDDWPHRLQGQAINRADITGAFINIDAAVNGAGRFKLGVITRIDSINADITYFCDFPFIATTTQLSVVFRGTPLQVKADLSGGILQHILSNSKETAVGALNTVTALSSPNGNVAPGLGDIVLKLEQSAGNYNIYSFLFYHTH